MRCGVTMAELLISLVLLTTVISVFTTMTVHIHHVWREISYRRIALAELNNQLEFLTQLPATDLANAVEQLEVSAECQSLLSEAKLTGTFEPDNLGTRVTLQINWKRKVEGLPLELIGWSLSKTESSSSSKTEDSEPDGEPLSGSSPSLPDRQQNLSKPKMLAREHSGRAI